MKKIIGAFLLLLSSSVFKGMRSSHTDHLEVAKLKMSLMYVQSIKTFRLLFISLLGMGICLVFLLAAIILFHVSLFLYAPWSMNTKMTLGLLCSLIYFIATMVVFSQVFAADKWLRIFHAENLMDHLYQKEATQQDSVSPLEQR